MHRSNAQLLLSQRDRIEQHQDDAQPEQKSVGADGEPEKFGVAGEHVPKDLTREAQNIGGKVLVPDLDGLGLTSVRNGRTHRRRRTVGDGALNRAGHRRTVPLLRPPVLPVVWWFWPPVPRASLVGPSVLPVASPLLRPPLAGGLPSFLGGAAMGLAKRDEGGTVARAQFFSATSFGVGTSVPLPASLAGFCPLTSSSDCASGFFTRALT